MEAVKIIMPVAERKPCVCGATVVVSRTTSAGHLTEVWLCSRHCGARGLDLRRRAPAQNPFGSIELGRPAPKRSSAHRSALGRARQWPVCSK